MSEQALLVLAMLTCVGCRETRDTRRLSRRAGIAPDPVLNGACELQPFPLVVAKPGRLIAIGDLHGDLSAARAAFRTAEVIDEQDGWVGSNAVVVQMGDVLDRGDDEVALLEWIERLNEQATAKGGAVISLVGNHEIMNAVGDFRFVTPAGRLDFGANRAQTLRPGGRWARVFAKRRVVVIVGDTVLAHAGITQPWVSRADEVNLETSCWFAGQSSQRRPDVYLSNDSPVWARAWGRRSVDCYELQSVLTRLGAKRMVVAHTPQRHINSMCNDTLWRIDVGLSEYFNGVIEVLDLSGSPRVMRGERL